MGEGTGVTNTKIVGLRCLIEVIVESGECLENLVAVAAVLDNMVRVFQAYAL